MADLPGNSRISCRIEGDEIVFTIPRSSGGSRGCVRGNWAVAAVCGFLAVTFVVQGFLTRNLGWTFAAVLCFLIAAWQLLALGGSPIGSGGTRIRVGPQRISEIAGAGDAQVSEHWDRFAIANICVEGESGLVKLQLQMKEKEGRVCLLSGDRDELEWIAEQIKHKWEMT